MEVGLLKSVLELREGDWIAIKEAFLKHAGWCERRKELSSFLTTEQIKLIGRKQLERAVELNRSKQGEAIEGLLDSFPSLGVLPEVERKNLIDLLTSAALKIAVATTFEPTISTSGEPDLRALVETQQVIADELRVELGAYQESLGDTGVTRLYDAWKTLQGLGHLR